MVRAPRGGYFNVKGGGCQLHRIEESKIIQLITIMTKASDKPVGGPPALNISDRFGGGHGAGFKIPGVG